MQEIENELRSLADRRAALDAEADELRSRAVAHVAGVVKQLGITQEELFPSKRAHKAPAAAPMYRDPATGKTWSGRGKPPNWIKDLDQTSRDALRI